MIKPDNYAGRLYLILESAKSKGPNLPTRHVWAEVFQIDKNNIPLLFYHFSNLQKLYSKTKASLLSIDNLTKNCI